MFTDKDISTALYILDGINIPEHFGTDDGWIDTQFIYSKIKDKESPELGKLHIDYGVTKLVIIFDNLPFVIKIPFNGQWYEQETDDGNYESAFGYYCCSGASDETDYCEAEVAAIEAAKYFGFGDIFADEECVANIDGFNIYLQVKVRSSHSTDHYTPNNDSLKKADNKDYYGVCDDMWRACVIECYGEQYLKDFISWAQSEREEILCDLHGGNYGYNMDGRPVLFDVSGYYD